jgi:hypothetical protein
MDDLTTLPNHLDVKNYTCRAIIETPKSSRNKFDYAPSLISSNSPHCSPKV